ncbi:MAG: nitroreductase family protein [Actinobacteria bacterium]|nr:nitroreductase family protein [Actinomycetota bacterium]MBW3643789.1 nitroreductase family protein [Actinomycetota bacterium]
MELRQAIRHRRMVRNFQSAPVASDVLDRLLDAARRAPSAGFAQGIDLLALEGPEQTARYWELALPEATARAAFRWQGLLDAPVLVVVLTSPAAYGARYGEADKAASGAAGPEEWTVPWWWVDAGMAAMLLLLAAVDEGLAALLFATAHESPVLAAFGVPDGHRAVATVAIGHPAPDEPGRSASRPRRPFDDVVHRGRW